MLFPEGLFKVTFCARLKATEGNYMNSRVVKLSRDTILEAHKYAAVFSRSVSNQIEHWTKIGRIAEENPDLPYNFIKDILISMEEMKTEKPVPYEFG